MRKRSCFAKAGHIERSFVWFWTDGFSCCAIVTHDIETSAGVAFCSQLMDLDESFGLKSSFQVVPEKRYTVSTQFLEELRKRGFESNIHDLNRVSKSFSKSCGVSASRGAHQSVRKRVSSRGLSLGRSLQKPRMV